jgi:hypothetical protein
MSINIYKTGSIWNIHFNGKNYKRLSQSAIMELAEQLTQQLA